jgi:multicomponent Na+:H+ antiporter subunit D
VIEALLPSLIVGSSFVLGGVIFALGEDRTTLRTVLNLGGAALKVALVAWMGLEVLGGDRFENRLPVMPGVDLVLRADALSLLLVALSAVLWLVTTIYAVGYLEGSPHRRRFFGFFSVCVSATTGIALAGNLFTFVFFYELLTLSTYPLVVHRGTEAALRGGRIYLAYTLAGGTAFLVGIVWLTTLAGSSDFAPGGFVAGLVDGHRPALIAIFFLLVGGLGVKAAIVPLHGWLPVAMVAPAPVSALLHAVAVVKAGAFGIVRVVYDVFGIQTLVELGLDTPLVVAAAVTIVYGSLRALGQDDLKRRLAFSTVSQVSYIALGSAVAGPTATIGGLVHLVHQGLMKITLFFCAGNLAETLGIHRVSEMDGVGRRMPATMVAFSIGALGMIGVPPLAGFVSKWFLATGALEADQPWVIGVLLVSSGLNAAYFLPILGRAWFAEPASEWPEGSGRPLGEAPPALLAPPVVTALLVVLVGVFAGAEVSPLALARFITGLEYAP